jgi:hypothetical protein
MIEDVMGRRRSLSSLTRFSKSGICSREKPASLKSTSDRSGPIWTPVIIPGYHFPVMPEMPSSFAVFNDAELSWRAKR